MFERVEGSKTYVVGVLTIVWGITGLIIGKLEMSQAVEVILAGLGLIGIRSALKKME